MEGSGALAWVRTKPFALWVIAGGLVYASLAFLALLVPLVLEAGLLGAGGILIFFFLFVALFLVGAVFTLKQKRWAYLLSAAVSVVFVLLNLRYIVPSLSNPADSSFWLSISLVPILLLAAGYAVLSFWNAKTGLLQKSYLATAHSNGGLLTLGVIGFVIGGIVVGAIGAGVILRNLSAGTADIEIVTGAMTAAVPFSPRTYTVTVGTAVTWINKDQTGVAHTVTSNVTGQFESGMLTTGATFSHTFTAAGTYYYHCTPHPQMWGVVIVA